MTRAASGIEVRLRPEHPKELEQASALLHMTTSDFIREAVALRAEQVLTEEAATLVAPDFFDSLLAGLEEPCGEPGPNRRCQRGPTTPSGQKGPSRARAAPAWSQGRRRSR